MRTTAVNNVRTTWLVAETEEELADTEKGRADSEDGPADTRQRGKAPVRTSASSTLFCSSWIPMRLDVA